MAKLTTIVVATAISLLHSPTSYAFVCVAPGSVRASNVVLFGAKLEGREIIESTSQQRRDVLQTAISSLSFALPTMMMVDTTFPSAAAAAAVVTDDINNTPPQNNVIRAPGLCAYGTGEGCDALSENNVYIQQLQQKSRDNGEINKQEALDAYYTKNYPDVFAVSDKKMVRKANGRGYVLYTTEEVQTLTDDGKIRLEYPKTMGGRITDLTRKPILVLVE
jgi:hypothetical protein